MRHKYMRLYNGGGGVMKGPRIPYNERNLLIFFAENQPWNSVLFFRWQTRGQARWAATWLRQKFRARVSQIPKPFGLGDYWECGGVHSPLHDEEHVSTETNLAFVQLAVGNDHIALKWMRNRITCMPLYCFNWNVAYVNIYLHLHGFP